MAYCIPLIFLKDLKLPLTERVSRTLSTCGPSICLAASAEAATFALGIAVPVPAVRTFSLCAFFAIVLDFILQVFAKAVNGLHCL